MTLNRQLHPMIRPTTAFRSPSRWPERPFSPLGSSRRSTVAGAGSSGGDRRELARRPALVGAAVALAVAFVAFVPPWLSARLTDRGQFRWAKRLDPLTVDPYVAESARAGSPRASAAALEAAVRKEPRVVELRYDLALAYLRAREPHRARTQLLVARRLDPREPRIQQALKNLPKRSVGSS